MHYRTQIRELVECSYLNKSVTGADFLGLLDLFLQVLPAGIDEPSLHESLRHLAGVPLTADVIDEAAWRMAGNYRRLAEHCAVPSWTVQRWSEWVPVQIVSCRRMRGYVKKGNKFDRPGAEYGFRILTGTSCSKIAFRWWSLPLARYYANDFGYDRLRGQRPVIFGYSQPEQLVGLRCNILVDPALCQEQPGFRLVGFSPSMTKRNREVIAARLRVTPGYTCPQGYANDFPCHCCPIGFRTCRAATHRNDWVKRHCPVCNTESRFDQDLLGAACVVCTRANAYKRPGS